VSITRKINADKCIQPGIDIEVAIRNNGLDVGIFGREDRLCPELAEQVLEAIKQDVLGVVGESSPRKKQFRLPASVLDHVK
jgi:hypothetical protein